MAAVANRMDELVKDYLLFRGLTSSLKNLELELKNEKEKGLRVDRIMEQINSFISSYDLLGLRDYWSYLSHRFFSRLEQRYMPSVQKLESSLFKYYLVNAHQTSRPDRVRDFFEVMTGELQNQPEFKDWFAFPFLKAPEENSTFSMYFQKHWQDTFFLSLHNFVSIILQAMPTPVLMNFEQDQRYIRCLREENETLIQKLQSLSNGGPVNTTHSQMSGSTVELMDDFASIAEDITPEKTHQKSEKRFNFSFPGSPLLGKKTNTQQTSGIKLSSQTGSSAAVSAVETHRTIRSQTDVTSGIDPMVVPMKTIKKHTVTQSTSGQLLAAGVSNIPQIRPSLTSRSGDPKQRKHEEFERQRRQLLRHSSAESGRDKKSTDSEGTSKESGVNRELSETHSESEPIAVAPSPTDRLTHSSESPAGGSPHSQSTFYTSTSSHMPVVESPFFLLSQEDYSEHHSAVASCQFSCTGHYVSSVDTDGVVKVWSWSPQPSTRATIMSKSPFLCAEWSSKTDRLLLLGNKTGNIRVFDVKENKSICEVPADASYPRIVGLCANPVGTHFICSGVAEKYRSNSGGDGSCGKIGRLTAWELKSMKMLSTLPLSPGPVAINCMALNHNGQLLLTGGADGIIRLFDWNQSSCIAEWPAHSGDVVGVQFSSDETSCYSMGADNKFTQWSINKCGTKMTDLSLHAGACQPVPGSKELPRGRMFDFDPEGTYVLTCAKSGGMIYQLTDTAPGLARVMDLKGHKSPITTVNWSPSVDTRVCLTGSQDGKVKVSTLLPY